MKVYKYLILAMFALVLASCASAPVVTSRDSDIIIEAGELHFYIVGSPRFGINNLIEEKIVSLGYHVEVLSDKRDIPRLTPRESDLRIKQFIVAHEFEHDETTNLWRLEVKLFEFNPRGVDAFLGRAFATDLATSRALVDAVVGRLFGRIRRV